MSGITGIDEAGSTNDTYQGGLVFKTTHHTGDDAMKEQMRINNQGNVGIGTTNPVSKLQVVGTTTSTDFNAISDIRHKENIHELENALEKILSIRGVNFTFLDDDEKRLHAGIIAQEVQPIIPELINTTNDDKWTANYDGLTPYLIECVKTLSKENETIRQDNKELKDKIETLETKIDLIMQQLNP